MPMDRYRPFALTAAVLAAAVFPPPAGATHPGEGGVTLYAGGNFRDASETFFGDVPSLRHSRVGNDHASSVRLAPGCTATLYEHEDYRGRSTWVDRDVADLRRTAVGNDAVSSLRVHCEAAPGRDLDWRYGGGVALYAGSAFEGLREVFYRDDPNLSNNRIGNDTARSVRVAPGCRAILYAGGDFRGQSVELTYDVRDLGATPVGNGAVSSLAVECDPRNDRWRDRPEDRWGDRDDRRNDDRRGDRDDRRGDDRDDPPGSWGSPWDRGEDRGGYGDDRGGYGDDRGGYDDRGGVTLYRGGDFRGEYETFFGDVPDLSRTAVGNDHASSVRVAPGCRVILYRDADYRGEAAVLTRDEPNLTHTPVGNDAVSSIEVDCRR